MKQMKRAFAMLLCVAMVLSLCVTFAGAADIRRYNTLDEIPEDFNVFRSIRTGVKSHVWIDGNSYWQFAEKGYPTVQIKASAFMTAPNNGYLTEDNVKLSENCKNAPPENVSKGDPLEDGGAYRVCYYKTMSVRSECSDFVYGEMPYRYTVYTVSMYRLELKANAFINRKQIYVEAKLTSGVTFEYSTGKSIERALDRKDAKLPVVPNVSVSLYDGANLACTDVNMVGYSISGLAPYCEVPDLVDIAGLLWSAKGCISSAGAVAVMVAQPETTPAIKAALKVSGALTDCGFFLKDAVNMMEQATSTKSYASAKIEDYSVNARRIVSPLKLTSCNHYVGFTFYLDNWRDESKHFKVNFGFDSVSS